MPTKLVNGVRVDLTEEEVAERAAEEAEVKAAKAKLEADKKRADDIRSSALAKLKQIAGLSDEEIEAISK